MQLILESDDGTQFKLNEGGCVLLDGYYPETTDRDEHVTDSFDVRINGVYSVVQGKLRDLNRMLEYASENKIGPFGVWLKFALNESDVLWRSRVYGGLVEYDRRMSYYLKRNNLKIGLILERDGFWEGPEAQIPLTNGNGTNNTAGLNVYNCNDGTGDSPNKKNNYVEIAEGVVEGDLPAPIRLEMRNDYDSANRLYNIWISQNVRSNPELFQHIIEGEAVTFGGSDTVSSSYSGGKLRAFTISGDNQQIIARWALDTNFLNRANKRWFKVLAALPNILPGYRLQCKITFPSGTPLTVVASSQEIQTTYSQILEIGELQIPPWLLSSGDLSAVDLTLYAKKVGGGTIGIDYLQITPVDGYRVLIPRGYGAAYQVRVVDDGIDDQIWTDGWSSGGKTGHYTNIGKPIEFVPNKKQRLYFLQSGDTGDININRVLSVKAFYRPRRRGL